MSERRFFTFPELVKVEEEKLILPPDESHHAFSVLRLREGDAVTVSDNESLYKGIIESISNSSVMIRIESLDPVRIPAERVYLFQAIPKGKKADGIVEIGTELGIDGFYFFKSDRSLGEISDKRFERFKKIAVSASKQSKRDYLPELTFLKNVEDALSFVSPRETVIVFDEQEGIEFQKIDISRKGGTEIIKYFVGPEGGFSDRERKLFSNSGAILSRLNSNILRTETASVVCATLILYRLGRI